MVDVITHQRERSQQQQELLIAELNHRVRNILNLIRSLVSQSQDDALSVSAFAKLIGGRISALASAHDIITRENWSPAPLTALFETELAAYVSIKGNCFRYVGDEFLIKPEAYTSLALVVHELVTNAAKYGALSDNGGSVLVSVSRADTGDLTIEWREAGGPPVRTPYQRGFGSTIIERSIPFELGGQANMQFEETGLVANFVIPAHLVEDVGWLDESAGHCLSSFMDELVPRYPHAVKIDTIDSSTPEHVLVVEDSMLIALDTEKNLGRLGVPSVRVAGSVSGALSAINERRPDFAILDFNLGEENCAPVAQVLNNLGVPFVIASGYSDVADQYSSLGAQALICKPYGREDIRAMLATAKAYEPA